MTDTPLPPQIWETLTPGAQAAVRAPVGRLERDGTIPRSTFLQYMAWLRPMVRSSLGRGSGYACTKTAATCGELLRPWECLWTFTRVEGVEPTNNVAERALRHAVIWRRISRRTDSETGSRFAKRMLSTVATCRQQGRGVLESLIACHEARSHGHPAPSLLAREIAGRSATCPTATFQARSHGLAGA
jgi:transposase